MSTHMPEHYHPPRTSGLLNLYLYLVSNAYLSGMSMINAMIGSLQVQFQGWPAAISEVSLLNNCFFAPLG